MRRSSTFLIVVLVQCVFSLIAPQSFNLCFAQPRNGEGNMLPLSTALVPVSGETAFKMVHTTVPWEGREYPAAEGVDVLMKVIVDPSTDAEVRAMALDKLKRLGASLRNTNYIPELIALYDTLRERAEKGELLLNLISSEDPRALTVFVRILDKEEDTTLRLVAADGLANWNVRRGVADLLGLFDCKEHLNSDRIVRDEVANAFRRLNRSKGWGCPEQEIMTSLVEKYPDRSPEEGIGLYISEIRKWFAENEHRFPDWKPGDPLPEAPGEAPKPKGSE